MSGGCPRFEVLEVQTPGPISIVSPSDFVTQPAGSVSVDEVLRDPRYTLYCFDPLSLEAVFVEARDMAAVERAPFYYQGQREQAAAIVTLPFEQFVSVGREIPPALEKLIWVHSVGRCGSTLISKVLESVPSVHSLSEPDDLTQLGKLRQSGEWPDERVRDALAAAVSWRCKSLSDPIAHVAIKTRSEVLAMADLLGSLFPLARHLFLYRDALAWMRTIFRGVSPEYDVHDEEKNRRHEKGWGENMPLVEALRDESRPKNIVQTRTLCWANCMESYLELQSMAIPTCAVRFEDLTAEPIPILRQVLKFCLIEDGDWTAIEEVLGRDSQAGTIYDREERRKQNREMTPELVQDLYDTLATRPLLGRPDVVVPGTLSL